ncbi:hypothetical protein LPJ61_005147, partial [Coemansia biformis]
SVLLDSAAHQVRLLDCEFTDIGPVSGDIGHFVAHLLPLHFLCNADYNPNTDPCPAHIAAFLTAYRRTLAAEHPAAFRALVTDGDAARLSSMFLGIEMARDVLNGNWCDKHLQDFLDGIFLGEGWPASKVYFSCLWAKQGDEPGRYKLKGDPKTIGR